MSDTATLIVLVGLPGAGKTTTARRLAEPRRALHWDADDWLDGLGVDLWDSDMRARVEGIQARLVVDVLQAGVSVIITWGTWARAERDALLSMARTLGVRAELQYLTAPVDVLLRRLSERDREHPPITREALEEWSALIEPPDAHEVARWDDVKMINTDQPDPASPLTGG